MKNLSAKKFCGADKQYLQYAADIKRLTVDELIELWPNQDKAGVMVQALWIIDRFEKQRGLKPSTVSVEEKITRRQLNELWNNMVVNRVLVTALPHLAV